MASVSAVVVNFNGGERILKCLDALQRQTAPLQAIVVVDNHSTDGSLNQIRNRFPRVQVLELGENRGLPAARNAGLRLATAEMELLNTYDVYMTEDSLARLVEVYERSGPTVVCPRVVLYPETGVVHCDGAALHFVGTLLLRHGFQPLEDTPAVASAVDACMGACLLVDRKRVLGAGGFDEALFFYFEDLEFSMRLRSLGHEIVCEPAAVVHHHRAEGTPGVAFRGQGVYPPRRAFLTMAARLRSMLIHYRMRTLLVLSPALALYELASLAACIRRGWGSQWLRAWGRQARTGPDIWARRSHALRLRTRNDSELLTGGPLPLAPGFVRSRVAEAAVSALTKVLNSYWRFVRGWVG
jgi:GT2 family glycosyltransferase